MRRWTGLGLGALTVLLGAGALAGCVADAAPEIGTAVAGEGKATVTWSTPLGDPGVNVAAYVVTPFVDGVAQPARTFASAATTQTVGGLAGGVTYTFSVHAISARGNESANSMRSNPVTPTGPSVATGAFHSCAVRSDGRVSCWGNNQSGQLGNGGVSSTEPYGSSAPALVVGITTAVSIAAGQGHSCAVLVGGSVECWGQNYSGELGNGTVPTTPPFGSPVPAPVLGIGNATAVAAGTGHTCARLADGTVTCWGKNPEGQLGNGTTVASPTPVAVVGITNATSIVAGGAHTCAHLASGSVVCWGSSDYSQAAPGTNQDQLVPRAISSIPGDFAGPTRVAAGSTHTCSTVQDGTVRCWGHYFSGYGLTQISGATNTTDVSAGGLHDPSLGDDPGHTCALLATGRVRCWGFNASGQLGNGASLPGASSTTAVRVSGLLNATSVAAGGAHTCARLTDDTVKCWGYNGYGQLGNAVALPGTASSTPVAVVGL